SHISPSRFFSLTSATTEMYSLSLHDALPIFKTGRCDGPNQGLPPCSGGRLQYVPHGSRLVGVQLVHDGPVDVETVQATHVGTKGLELGCRVRNEHVGALRLRAGAHHLDAPAQGRGPSHHLDGLAPDDLGLVLDRRSTVNFSPGLTVGIQQVQPNASPKGGLPIFPTDFVVGRPVPAIAPAIRSLLHPTKNRTDGKLLPRLELKRRARPLSLGLAEESEKNQERAGQPQGPSTAPDPLPSPGLAGAVRMPAAPAGRPPPYHRRRPGHTG